jgi:hypothetical protein
MTQLFAVVLLLYLDYYTAICFFSTTAKFGICTVAGLNGTLVEDKIRKF